VGKLSKDGIDLLESLDNWSWDLDKKIKKKKIEGTLYLHRKKILVELEGWDISKYEGRWDLIEEKLRV